MTTQIKFGTSGWRAVMADEFTFANVRRAVTGIASYAASQKPQGARILVGHDPRFLGETFCDLAAQILIQHGITPVVIPQPAPTPAIAFEVIRLRADGAINFTASHNPPEYNGIKFSTPDGAPALPEVTTKIEAEIASLPKNAAPASNDASTAKSNAATIDVAPNYLARLAEILDLKAIAKAKLRVGFDPLWGAARGYPDSVLREAGVDVFSLHD